MACLPKNSGNYNQALSCYSYRSKIEFDAAGFMRTFKVDREARAGNKQPPALGLAHALAARFHSPEVSQSSYGFGLID
jgi:hypothetical protein